MFCIKCGSENPAGAEFCWKCGVQLFIPELSTGATSDSGLRTDSSGPSEVKAALGSTRPIGIGGWLALLCVVLGILTPVSWLLLTLRLLGGGITPVRIASAVIACGLAISSFSAALKLYRKDARGIEATKTYIVANVAAVSFVLTVMNSASLLPLLEATVAGTIWWLYLDESVRVRNTYGPTGAIFWRVTNPVCICIAVLLLVFVGICVAKTLHSAQPRTIAEERISVSSAANDIFAQRARVLQQPAPASDNPIDAIMGRVPASARPADDSDENNLRIGLKPDRLMVLCGRPLSDSTTRTRTLHFRFIKYIGVSGSSNTFVFLGSGKKWVLIRHPDTDPAASVLLSELPCLQGLPRPSNGLTDGMTAAEIKRQKDLLQHLTLDELVTRCGPPLEDRTSSSYSANLEIVERHVSYRTSSGSVVTLQFNTARSDGRSWSSFFRMKDGRREYDDMYGFKHILTVMPCIETVSHE